MSLIGRVYEYLVRVKATEIESSKVFQIFNEKYNIPTANYEVFQNSEKAFDYIKQQAFPLVIKADGLAAGKGVFIVKDLLQARDALDALMEEKKFGEAGKAGNNRGIFRGRRSIDFSIL